MHFSLDSAGGPTLIPRSATLDGSPFLRPRKNRGGTVNLPGMGVVKLRHGTSHHQPLQFPSPGPGVPMGGPNLDPDRIPDDLMSLEDFLAESVKQPNRVS